jgi:regulator of PEP synthase PpsR (kinase-PPPase family)
VRAGTSTYEEEFMADDHTLMMRAIAFVTKHEDGAIGSDILEADVVLVGQSRASKTPTGLYIAWKYCVRVACVPFVHGIPLPEELSQIESHKIFVLDLVPARLLERRARRVNELGHVPEAYIDPKAIRAERTALLQEAEGRGWQQVNVTGNGIEETASEIARLIGLKPIH